MKLPALLFLFLFLSSFAVSSARADSGALDGHWRGTYSSPSSENVIDLELDQSTGVYRGHDVGAIGTGTFFPLIDLEPGQLVRIVVPNVGIFQGRLHNGVLEGTFTGAAGSGPFRLDRAPEPDFQFVD